jgi:predicted dehydrogenase
MAGPMKLGVVGAGSIALRGPLPHIMGVGDVRDRVTITAIMDPVPGRARAAAEKFGVKRFFEDYDALLEDGDVDAVTICSPIGLHAEQGLKALRAGKHVHFNKTMTTTTAEADAVIAEAAKRNLRIVASPGQMLRPQNLRIRQLIREGAIGRVAWAAIGAAFGDYHEHETVRTGGDVLTNVDPSWYFRKPGGGPLYDMTVYGLHTLTGVLGPAKRVTAMSGVLLKEREFRGARVPCDADDNSFLTLDFGDATFAFVYGAAFGWLVPSLDFPTYYGTKGEIAGTNLNGKPIDYPGRDRDKDGSGRRLTPHVRGRHAEMEEAHVFEDIMQLADWVLDGVPSPVTAEHARHVIEIIEAGYRAASTGRTQELTTTFAPLAGA